MDFVSVSGLDVDDEISVLSTDGKLIMSLPANGLRQIDVSRLSKGVYFMRTRKGLSTRFIKT